MAEHYVIAYNGQVAEGKSLAAVKQGVAQLFKVDVSKVEHFFSGQWSSIKKGVDEATAKKYQAALAKVGAVCRVVSESQFAELKAAPAAATSAPAPIEKPQTGAYSTSETGDTELERSVIKEAPSGLGDLENILVEASWDHLEEPDNTPPPKVDLSGVVLTERGTDLVNHHEDPELVVDTSELTLDAPGVDMAEHEDVPDLEVDTSGMVIDEPGVIIVEHKEAEEPEIDISKLSLE